MTGKIYRPESFTDVRQAEDVAGDMARDLGEPCLVLQNLHTDMYWPVTVEASAVYLEDAQSYVVASFPFGPEGGLRDDAPEREEYNGKHRGSGASDSMSLTFAQGGLLVECAGKRLTVTPAGPGKFTVRLGDVVMGGLGE